MMKKYLLVIFLMCLVVNSFSNNITISNVTLVGKNTTDHYVLIQFDLSWENSWRTSGGPQNWDAAWVFVKFRVKGQTDWRHASLNWTDGTGSGDGHTVPAGAVIKGDIDTGDGNSHGVFIYANGDKSQGTANYPGAQLRWQYGEDNIKDHELVEICVFGIEMVYVSEGAFQVGALIDFYNSFHSYPSPADAYPIESEGAITVGTSNGNFYYFGNGDQSGPIPPAFPKGYNAFYCMKYEITQEQYVEFLLKLTSAQANLRAYTSGGNRNTITGSFGTHHTSSPYVACNFLSWADLTAYLDWACLRPMTELEYEKACRGTVPAVLLEFAWGTSTRAVEEYVLSNSDLDDESIEGNYNISSGNLSYGFTDPVDGPLRVGIFAAHPSNSGRITSGATYYGIMEMTGNLREQTVTVGNLTGRTFMNSNGDGSLTVNGDADTFSWPGTNAVGAGQRGGAWNTSMGGPGHHFPVSSRPAAAVGLSTRENYAGGRGVRTAP